MSSYIRQIQTQLKEHGLYTGEIDGIAGRKTLEAVKQALAANKCSVDDVMNVATANATDVTVKQLNEAIEKEERAVIPDAPASGYKLGEGSLKRLNGVKPQLVKVVKRAIEISKVDFTVHCGLRTKQEQARLVRIGASQTMNSKHLTGDAVDLVPVINGKPDHVNWNHYYPLAEAMTKAATELGVKVKWGGCWEVINGKTGNPKAWVEAYGVARRKLGKKAFTDGPHFELA